MVQLAIDIPSAPFPLPARFNKEWRSVCTIRRATTLQLSSFIQSHYLHKKPAVVVLSLAMFCHNQPVGCVIYAEPPREVSTRYGGYTWELARLYILDEIPSNAETWLIGQSVRWIKKHHPSVSHLISYADPSQGHHGTIYKAANWKEDGMTDENRTTARSDYYDQRTGVKYGRKGNMPKNAVIERLPRQSKHRFKLTL